MEGTDQIFQLPQPILDHILSFFAIKDAAKTSTLSKVWNSVWTSLSSLNFGDNYFRQSKNIVDQILANRLNQNISIKRFKVNVPNYRSKDVDNWIEILVTCNIKELFLEVGIYTYNKLPEVVFDAKALNVLSLRGFKLELPSGGIKFSSLRELYLVDSFLDEQLLQALCKICIHLEVLSLSGFHGLMSLQVSGTLPKLRTVKLLYYPPKFKMVDIVAPNLKDLYISSFGQDLRVINITACKSVKHLKLTSVAVTDQWLEDLFSNLSNLEICYLFSCSSLKIIKISSYRLKLLKVVACYNLIAIDLDTPNLLRITSDVHHGKEELLFKLKASQLLEAKIKLIPGPEDLDTHWYSKLANSLVNFNHSRAITLSCDEDKVIVIPKDMRENLFPPLSGPKGLHIKIMDWSNYSVVDVVDSLLWMSPQLDTLSVYQGRDLKSVIKFTYRDEDEADDEDEKPCCASLPWKCWKHELKKVKLQNFTCTELEKLRNYFLSNTDILEKIIEDPP
ncbi:F-box/FBD/LRR-repeat protein At5g56420-like isoform X1 [Nicotiana tomentosiformis]|uniref:F-box/FBD/LRR-repeat protein At5g56420-like isoform X1 n=1 Tax=Nicotiana tomentosiformis TaxID=4098 RepID=UPI00051BD835|nr:F-box/FBD/LRR-repeat protein At3g51530-like [Nicotiana tomentosiformis]